MGNSYHDVAETLGSRDSRKVANNSYLVRLTGEPDREGRDGPDGAIAYRLHGTYVVIWHPNGDVELNTGGWRTVTTKDRINRCLQGDSLKRSNCWATNGFSVYSDRGTWKLYQVTSGKQVRYGENFQYSYSTPIREAVAEFADGMVIHADGSISGAMTTAQIKARDQHNAKLSKLLKRYIAAITPTKIVKAEANHGGDCMYCQLRAAGPVERVSVHGMTGLSVQASRDGAGPAIGDALGNDDHLWSHLEERYFMRSTCINAIEFCGYRPDVYWAMAVMAARGEMHGSTPHIDDNLTRMLKRYFTAKLRAS